MKKGTDSPILLPIANSSTSSMAVASSEVLKRSGYESTRLNEDVNTETYFFSMPLSQAGTALLVQQISTIDMVLFDGLVG